LQGKNHKSMRIIYDRSVDAAYIYLTDIKPGGAKKTYLCDPRKAGEINLDFDGNGRLLGIEILDASKKLPEGFFDENKIEYL